MYCGEQVLNSELQAHINKYHPENNDQEDVDYVTCIYCGEQVPSSELQAHINNYHPENNDQEDVD